ncbi:MAG TPA: maleylpyruvate isomerase N-terminal domain-containing protein [Nocardiopsis listeri]|uniref:maleylpyruvate isomerase N-terminal domain-containing protein n=1 Tax=Nocardiopsis listeri TaxID=53440 RepID=UPI001DC78156|nr:maleylpyruvate isomerase N-terminal domain-containing protein [Nocardiopsis listeri]HJE59550.1 maleylpyruvate isomerase N-terminal domain-containing protein [Nocardiopsis listeri]
MFERGVVVAALTDEVAALEEVLSGLSESDVVKSTRCVPWDVAALSVHTVGSLNQVLVALDGGAADPDAALVSAAGYYSPRVRFSPEVDRARVDSALERAERRSDAAEPGRVLGGLRARLWPRLARVPEDRTMVTRHGDPMLVTEYLVTRVVESLLHGLDLADALGREPWASDRALGLVGEVLFGGADAEALERVLPGARGANALGAVRVVTGRAPVRVGRAVLEGAGVRVLALG